MDTDRQQKIQERAYAIWEAEGRPDDRADAHWQQAEEQLSESDGAAAGEELQVEASSPAPAAPARRRKTQQSA